MTCIRLLFDESLETRERIIPMLRDAIEIRPHFLDARVFQPIEAFAPCPLAPDDTCALQHAEMFGDCLPRQRRSLRKSRDGELRAVAELADQRKPCGVAKGRKHHCVVDACGPRPMPSGQGAAIYSVSGSTSLAHSCGMPGRAGVPEARQIPIQSL